MFSKKVWCALNVLILLGVEAKDSDMTQAMKEFKIIPDVIDNGPKDKLTVSPELKDSSKFLLGAFEL